MVWVVVLIVPFGMLIAESGMNVNWATLGIPVITSPFLTPLFVTITWSKATAKGVISGNRVAPIMLILTFLYGHNYFFSITSLRKRELVALL